MQKVEISNFFSIHIKCAQGRGALSSLGIHNVIHIHPYEDNDVLIMIGITTMTAIAV